MDRYGRVLRVAEESARWGDGIFSKATREVRPERAHIVPENFDWLFESDYEPKWSETFLGAI